MSAIAILHLREEGGVAEGRQDGWGGGAHRGETPSIKLSWNYQPAARESQGFQSENRGIFFFSFLSAKSQQAVEQQGQAADNQIRRLVFLLQTTAGTSLSLLTGVEQGTQPRRCTFFAPCLNFPQRN